MKESFLDIIGQVFFFGILVTPVISFFIVRKSSILNIVGKIIVGVLTTLFLALIFYVIAITIAFRNGLGPS